MNSERNVLLIQLPSPYLLIEKWIIPNQLCYLREYLVKMGADDVEILNLAGEEKYLDKIPLNFKYYCLSFFTPQFGIAVEISDYIKKKSNGIIIAGGHHVTALPEESLKKTSIDIVVRGEGEKTLFEIVSGKDISAIQGITYKDEEKGRITSNERRELSRDIDDFDFDKYPGMIIDEPHSKYQMSLITSRGCPFSCAFCDSRKFWKQSVRFNSVDYVIDALEYLRSLGINDFRFEDDNFDLKYNRLEGVCQNLRKNKTKWSCMMRSENVTEDKIELMKQSGCVRIAIGVESASDKILKLISKKETVETHKKACKIISEAGIKIHAFLMAGLPGETQETVNETLKFIKTQPVDSYVISTFVPFPGTDIWNDPQTYQYEFDKDGYFDNFTLLSKNKMTPSVSKSSGKIAVYHKQLFDACAEKNTVVRSFNIARAAGSL